MLTFEDLTGSIEAVVFSEQLAAYRDLIGPDKVVYLKGTIDKRREEPSLRVAEVIALEDGPSRLAETLIIKVQAVGLEQSTMQRVKEVCKAHPGERAFYLRLDMPGEMTTLIRCDAALAVRPDVGFIRDMEPLLGKNAVELPGRGGATGTAAPAQPADMTSSAPMAAAR